MFRQASLLNKPELKSGCPEVVDCTLGIAIADKLLK
jgi:hypothetical protein